MDTAEINNIAYLARLAIKPEQASTYARELSAILDLVAQLQAVATTGIEPLAHPLEVSQRLRADVVTETDQHERFQALAPQAAEGLYLVPKVIE